MVRESDDADVDQGRRRILQGLAATGVGLAGIGQANADHRPGDAAGAAPGLVEHAPFFGFAHGAVGGAGLDPSGDSLVVDGPDGGGVRAHVGEAESFLTETGFDLGSEVGAYREFVGRGVVDGEPGRVVGSARLVNTGGEVPLELRPDFGPVGADGYDLEVYRRGERVHEGAGLRGYIPKRPRGPDPDDFEYEWVWTGAGWKLIIKYIVDFEIWLPDDDDDDESATADARAASVVGDEIHLTPAGAEAALGPVTHVEVLGDGQPEFALDGEAVGFQGHRLRQVGDAALHPIDGGSALGVTNLDEEGGVVASVEPGQSYGFTMQPRPLSADGARLAGRPRGVVDGVEQRLGEVGLTRDGDVVAIDADFTPVGTEEVVVGLFREGELFEEVEVGGGVLGHVADDPLFCWCPTWPWPPWCPPCPWPPWPPWAEFSLVEDGRPTPFPAIVDGEEFEVDRIRVGAGDPELDLDPEALTSSEVVGSGIEQFVLVDEPPSLP